MHHSHGRATLGGKLSAVLVAAGSSVGLGNIWRFPYVAGDNGGGAFLVIYILCVLLLGLPIMVAEFSVGRASHRNAVGAYRALDPKWSFLGYNGVVAAFLILGFYFVVSGWTAEYMVHSVTGSLARYTTADEYKSVFENFIQNPWRPVLYTALFVLAGVVIFPAVFSVGIEPSSGPSLVFITLPGIFNSMPLSMVWSSVFFLLLVVAALTSTISLHEVITAYMHEEWHMSRRVAAWSTTGACMALAAVASLSLGVLKGWNIFGLTIFDSLDYLTANILLPAGGFFTCIFVGWRLDRKILKAEISNNGTLKFRIYGVFIFLVRYVCPAVLLLIFLDNLGLF